VTGRSSGNERGARAGGFAGPAVAVRPRPGEEGGAASGDGSPRGRATAKKRPAMGGKASGRKKYRPGCGRAGAARRRKATRKSGPSARTGGVCAPSGPARAAGAKRRQAAAAGAGASRMPLTRRAKRLGSALAAAAVGRAFGARVGAPAADRFPPGRWLRPLPGPPGMPRGRARRGLTATLEYWRLAVEARRYFWQPFVRFSV
jgi:hypothetical protein